MEQILQLFKMTEEKFVEHKFETTNSIKKYYLSDFDIIIGKENGIPNHLEYLEFGADKCGFDNFIEFCEEINIDFLENISRIKTFTEKGYFHFYSRDKKITMTCSSLGNYVHYFGFTGEKSEVLRIFKIFYDCSTYEGLCWGGRDFI